MLSTELIQRLRCMQTQSSLQIASDDIVSRLNELICQGKAQDRLGRAIAAELSGGLVNAEQTIFYPITNDVVQLLQEESIELAAMEPSSSKQPIRKGNAGD